MLRDMGAEVIKIEAPSGDSMRYTQRQPRSPDGKSQQNGQVIDHAFTLNNRGKKSVCLNLKHPAAQALARDLCARADVVITNLLPRRLATYGLDYECINSFNPRVVFARYNPAISRPTSLVVLFVLFWFDSL